MYIEFIYKERKRREIKYIANICICIRSGFSFVGNRRSSIYLCIYIMYALQLVCNYVFIVLHINVIHHTLKVRCL